MNSRAWLLLPMIVAAVHVVLLWHYTVDDALITLRYARNAAAGLGPVYNVGERVEGFSNPLWLLLATAATALGANPLWLVKVVGGASAVAALGIAGGAAFRFGDAPTAAVLLTAVAAYTGYAYHAVAGLETGLHALLVTSLAAAVASRRLEFGAVLAALLVWSRPEGVLFTGVLLAGAERRDAARLMRVAWVPAVALGALFVVRWELYGMLLPNTFAAKMEHREILLGLGETVIGLGRALVPLTIPGGLALAAFGETRDRRLEPWLAVVLLSVGFTLVAGADWMEWARFVVPALPALAVLAAAGAARLGGDDRADSVRLLAWAGVVMGVTVGAWNRFLLEHAIWPVYPEMNGADHRILAEDVARRIGPGDTVAALQIGWIGWMTEGRVVDLGGLTDRRVPELLGAGDTAGYLAYLDASNPRLVVIDDKDGPHLPMGALSRLLEDHLLGLGWRKTAEIPLGAWRNAILLEPPP